MKLLLLFLLACVAWSTGNSLGHFWQGDPLLGFGHGFLALVNALFAWLLWQTEQAP